MAGSKRTFLRDHKFTVADHAVFFGVTMVIAMPMIYALVWLMSLALGAALPVDAALVLITLALLLSACTGMSVALTLIRWMAQGRSRPK